MGLRDEVQRTNGCGKRNGQESATAVSRGQQGPGARKRDLSKQRILVLYGVG
jgi:hypothetical protein